MNIVIDTNALIDGSSDDYNYGNRIIDEVLNGKLNAFANPSTLAENKKMARRKVQDEGYLAKLDQLFDSINLINTQHRLDVVEDWDDNKILESAVESGSEYLITSDNHLLKLGQYDKVKITTPTQFWSIYEEENGDGWKNWLNSFIR